MCGIESVFGPGIDRHVRRVFIQMLDAGKVRGEDATGLAAVSRDGSFKIVKDNLDGAKFVDQRLHAIERALEGNIKGLIGHNRLATMGENISANAHPFACGNLVGVHNGVISPRSLKDLPTTSNKDVDSHQLFHSMAESGIDSTLVAVNGDWALVWFDKSTNKYYFIRNSGRPLWYRYGKGKTLLWVLSEPDMGNWLVTRGMSHSYLDNEDWEPFKTDTLYSLDATQTPLELKEERKIEGKKWQPSNDSSTSNDRFSKPWLYSSTSNVTPFRPKLVTTKNKHGPTLPIPNPYSMKFNAIEDTPIFTIEELREMPEVNILTMLDRAKQSKGTLFTSLALDYLQLADNNWSGKLTWRESHREQVLSVVKSIAAQNEKLEVLNTYISCLEGQKKRHELFSHIGQPKIEEPKKAVDFALLADVRLAVKDETGKIVDYHNLMFPAYAAKTRDQFVKGWEITKQDHVRDFIGPKTTLEPESFTDGNLHLMWTAGQNLDDVDHVETCKRVHKWLNYLVVPKIKFMVDSSDDRDDLIEDFNKACVIKPNGMLWKAPSSLFVNKPIYLKMIHAFCYYAVQYGVTNRYLHPNVYAEKMLELIPPKAKEAA